METILAGHRYPSSARYDLVVIHTNEGPEGPTSAEGLAVYLHGKTGSGDPGYHRTVDENSAVITCPDDQRVNGAGGVNSRAFHICITGYAAQDLTQWTDRSSMLAMTYAAQEARAACQRLGVPLARITDPRTGRGICGHADVSRYYPASQGHTDPGAWYPWDLFLGLVTKAITPGPPKRRLRGMGFIQAKGGHAIAFSTGAAKIIMHDPHMLLEFQWCWGAQGGNINVSVVSQETWDVLPTANAG